MGALGNNSKDISTYERLRKRSEFSTVEGLKDLAFDRRLKKDYNREQISLEKDSNEKFDVIIQTSRLNESSDFKKISTKFSTPIKVGDVIYWDRLDSYWMIFLQRNTEKNYFLGEMQLAKYQIYWIDHYGRKRWSWGCLRYPSMGIDTYRGWLDVGAGSMQLLLPNKEEVQSLKRYDKIKLGRTVWKVIGVNEFNLDNIVILYLEETEGNSNYDTSKYPYGKVVLRRKLETCLDNLTSLSINSIIDLDVKMKVNGEYVQDTFTIKCTNCVYQDNMLIFPNLGKAIIEINTDKTDITQIIELDIVEEADSTEHIFIEGPETIQTMLSYQFKLVKNINGVSYPHEGVWIIEDPDKLIDYKVNKGILDIKVNNGLGKFKITCETKEGYKTSKVITVRQLF